MKKVFFVLIITTIIFNISCKNSPTDSENTAPIALFTISPTSGTTITSFTFDASGCTDAEDETSDLQVRWDWNNDGVWDTDYNANKTLTHQYTTVGTYTVALEVKDSEDLKDTATLSVNITAGNNAPTASFTVNPAYGTVNTIFNFDASGSSDNEDETSDLQVRWDWNNDGTYETNYNTTKTATQQYTTEQAYTVKLEVRDSEGWVNTTTKVVTVQRPSTVVTFSDDNFEASIRNTLNKWSGDITDIDMENITALDGSGWNIADISGIEYCINIKNLKLSNNQISDISMLEDLVTLQFLGLSFNQIVDISSLSNLSNLILLYLDNNQIININALGNLLSLTELYLLNNQIVDIYPLVVNSGIDNGDNIYLTNNPLSSTSINTYIPQLQARGVIVNF